MISAVAELYRVPRPHWKFNMQTIEITNPSEARRCRYAQYRGQKARLILNGVPVSGMIRAVKEDKSSTPMRWMVTVARPDQSRNG
jgi:hypothetical protein